MCLVNLPLLIHEHAEVSKDKLLTETGKKVLVTSGHTDYAQHVRKSDLEYIPKC